MCVRECECEHVCHWIHEEITEQLLEPLWVRGMQFKLTGLCSKFLSMLSRLLCAASILMVWIISKLLLWSGRVLTWLHVSQPFLTETLWTEGEKASARTFQTSESGVVKVLLGPDGTTLGISWNSSTEIWETNNSPQGNSRKNKRAELLIISGHWIQSTQPWSHCFPQTWS